MTFVYPDPVFAVSFISTCLETILKYIDHMTGINIYGIGVKHVKN